MFPRAASQALSELNAMANVSWTLSDSAVEFYMFQSFDLLAEDGGGMKVPVLIGKDHTPIGCEHLFVKTDQDIVKLLNLVNERSTTSRDRHER